MLKKYHYIKKPMEKGGILMSRVPSDENLADMR